MWPNTLKTGRANSVSEGDDGSRKQDNLEDREDWGTGIPALCSCFGHLPALRLHVI